MKDPSRKSVLEAIWRENSKNSEEPRLQEKIAQLKRDIQALEAKIADLRLGHQDLHKQASSHENRADAFGGVNGLQDRTIDAMMKKLVELKK